MVRQYVNALVLFILPLLITGCSFEERVNGSGKVVSEERKVPDFHAISISGTGTLDIKQGDKDALIIKTDDNLLPYIESEVRDGVLYLSPKKEGKSMNLNPSENIYYTATVKNLDNLSVAGYSDVHSIHKISGDRLNISVNGSATLDLDINVKSLNISSNGLGNVTLVGSADSVKINIAGAGAYNALDLLAKNAEVSVAGSGTISLNVSDTLDVNLAGAGYVNYKGNPKITSKIGGIGKLNKVD